MALTNLMRKENANLTDAQIREMLPIVHAQMQEQVAQGDLTVFPLSQIFFFFNCFFVVV